MKRKLIIGVLLAAVFAAGGTIAWTQTGAETVATQTFTNVVTYTIPTETVTTTQTETVVSTETVTVTSPTTTEPPTTTDEEPPPPGTTITLFNERFTCRGDLRDLGPLPIILEQTVMNNHPSAFQPRGVVDIESGCHGDGNPETVDLIIHQYGNGFNVGAAADPIVIFPGAYDLTITGFTDCGLIYPGADGVPRTSDDAHQDGFDVRGGTDILVRDYEMGRWDDQTATCQGAGALAYLSAFLNSHTPRDDPALLQRFVFERVKLVAAKEGVDPSAGPGGRAGFVVQSIDSGIRDSCLSGNIPLQVRLDTPSLRGAIRPINENNFLVDRDDGVPDNPAGCPLP